MNKIPFDLIKKIYPTNKRTFMEMLLSIYPSLEVNFIYKNKIYWICGIYAAKDKRYNRKVILYEEDCNNRGIQSFDSLDELYEYGKIDDKLLKCVWIDIKILSINASDPNYYYDNFID